MPEMTFGGNSVCIQGPNGWKCEFNTHDALDTVDKTGSQGIKVSYSEQWNKTRYHTLHDRSDARAKDSEDIRGVLKPYDWTYTTPYRGTLTQDVFPSSEDSIDEQSFTASKDDFPLDKLRRPDPILFFDEVDLYEDELGDNGMSLLSIKVRVMPARLLLLSRFLLRLDDVIFRVRDTRIYVEFETGQVIRNYTAMEGVYSKLKEVNPAPSPLQFPLLWTQDNGRWFRIRRILDSI
jgi:type 2A phosphatase activator TIP41